MIITIASFLCSMFIRLVQEVRIVIQNSQRQETRWISCKWISKVELQKQRAKCLSCRMCFAFPFCFINVLHLFALVPLSSSTRQSPKEIYQNTFMISLQSFACARVPQLLPYLCGGHARQSRVRHSSNWMQPSPVGSFGRYLETRCWTRTAAQLYKCAAFEEVHRQIRG